MMSPAKRTGHGLCSGWRRISRSRAANSKANPQTHVPVSVAFAGMDVPSIVDFSLHTPGFWEPQLPGTVTGPFSLLMHRPSSSHCETRLAYHTKLKSEEFQSSPAVSVYLLIFFFFSPFSLGLPLLSFTFAVVRRSFLTKCATELDFLLSLLFHPAFLNSFPNSFTDWPRKTARRLFLFHFEFICDD
jgi:hypothetical protein